MNTQKINSVTTALLLFTASIHALDTTEPFDIGFSDLEMVGAYSNLGDKENAGFVWEGVVGAGLTSNLSASFVYGVGSNQYLAGAEQEFSFGLFYTAIDKEMFKFDIFGGPSSTGDLGVGVELNLDFPRMGIQLSVEEGMTNRETPGDEWQFTTAWSPLMYYNAGNWAQVLTAVDFELLHQAPQGEDELKIGAFSLGFNFMAHSALEILTQLDFDIPQNEEDASVGFTLQFISTLPAKP